MKSKLLLLTIAGVTALSVAGCRKKAAESQAKKDLAPNITLTNLDSRNEWQLAPLLGQKTVLLAFFTTWCPYCNKSMPYLQNFYESNKNKNFELIGVDVEEEPAKVERLKKKFGLTFPLTLASANQVTEPYSVRFLPTLYLISREGKLLNKFEGFHPEIFDEVSRALE